VSTSEELVLVKKDTVDILSDIHDLEGELSDPVKGPGQSPHEILDIPFPVFHPKFGNSGSVYPGF
jgi:hypothetical protein